MSRIAALEPATASGMTRELLEGVRKALGAVPNLFRVAAQSPAALEGMVALNGAIGKALDARTRAAIALATAEANGCDYCLSAHTFLGKRAGLGEGDLTSARDGHASDPKVAAAAHFARRVLATRGGVSDRDLAELRGAGFDDAAVIDIVANIAMNVFTNFVNKVAATDIDFEPVVRHRENGG